MAWDSLQRFLLLPLLFGLMFLAVDGESNSVFYDWTASFIQMAPFGAEKQVIAINNQFPGPLLNTTTNDVVNVNVHNNLTEPLLITWNGVQLRRNSWQDGVAGTNCPIPPGQNWTYSFQVKDQIGSFFYFPSLNLQKAAGGYGPIRINNRDVIPIPFGKPLDEFDIMIGDWYNADYKDMACSLDHGLLLPPPDGILVNGRGPFQTNFTLQPGATYRLRISNVGLKTSLNFRIQNHLMLLVETEGSYTLQQYYECLDIHVGQSYSVLITANQSLNASYYMVAASKFLFPEIYGVALLHYGDYQGPAIGPLPVGPDPYDYIFSYNQALSIRWNLAVGAARPNPQGSYHYGNINISRTIVLQNAAAIIGNQPRYTVNNISYVEPDTPLKLADYFQINGVFSLNTIPDFPDDRQPILGTSVIGANYRDFIQIVFQNTDPVIQSWHIDGYNVFVVGMAFGTWDESKNSSYNMLDAVSRSTFQVYPNSWTAVLLEVDNQGMWNIRSQDAETRYLGQELYMRVIGVGEEDPSLIPIRDELPLPANAIRCGRTPST